jgi:hypothetical protein
MPWVFLSRLPSFTAPGAPSYSVGEPQPADAGANAFAPTTPQESCRIAELRQDEDELA